MGQLQGENLTPVLSLQPHILTENLSLFMVTPDGAHGLLLALCSGITPSELWGLNVISGIETKSDTRKASAPPIVLFLHPPDIKIYIFL